MFLYFTASFVFFLVFLSLLDQLHLNIAKKIKFYFDSLQMFCKKNQLFKEFIFIVEILNFLAANCSNSSSVR